jgi:hypothetical protein
MSELHDNEQYFQAEIERLRDRRPTLSPIQLDQIKQRARPRRQATSPFWRTFLRTRAAVITALAAGALMSSGGVALAVSGVSASGTASSAQYVQPGESGPQAANKSNETEAAVTPAEASAQQATASSGQLPFTGFVAVTLIVLGAGLTITGVVIRYTVTRPSRATRQ